MSYYFDRAAGEPRAERNSRNEEKDFGKEGLPLKNNLQQRAEKSLGITAAEDRYRTLQTEDEPLPETVGSDLYVPGFLMTQIGRYMRVEFLVGSMLTDRTGILTQVGASYIILMQQNGDQIVCDLFTIKFITITDNPNE